MRYLLTLRVVALLAVLGAMTFAGCARPSGEAPSVTIGSNRELRVCRPFFPIMNFYQSVKSFDNAAAMGLNGYFMPGKTPAREYLDALQAKGLCGIVLFDREVIGHPALLAWLQPHEPDVITDGKVRMPPAEVAAAYEKIRRADPSRPVVLDFSPNFMLKAEFAKGRTADQKRKDYAAFARGGDILTYNVYPIWLHNKPEKINWVAEAADDLRAIVGRDKPFFAMIETGKGSKAVPVDQQKDVTIDDIRAEVWMAITRGATGIIYFTHQFKPKFSEHAPGPDKHAAIKTINEQITRLAPVILGPPARETVEVSLAGGLATSHMARRHGGDLYVFVLNCDMQRRSGEARITIEGLKAGTQIQVVGEGRMLSALDGRFTDTFDPLALHIYRMRTETGH